MQEETFAELLKRVYEYMPEEYYVVFDGINRGIYRTFSEAKSVVKDYMRVPVVVYSESEAKNILRQTKPRPPRTHSLFSIKELKKKKRYIRKQPNPTHEKETTHKPLF